MNSKTVAVIVAILVLLFSIASFVYTYESHFDGAYKYVVDVPEEYHYEYDDFPSNITISLSLVYAVFIAVAVLTFGAVAYHAHKSF